MSALAFDWYEFGWVTECPAGFSQFSPSHRLALAAPLGRQTPGASGRVVLPAGARLEGDDHLRLGANGLLWGLPALRRLRFVLEVVARLRRGGVDLAFPLAGEVFLTFGLTSVAAIGFDLIGRQAGFLH